MKKATILLGVLLTVVTFSQCKKKQPAPPDPTQDLTPYTIETPNRFPQMVLNPDNPLTKEGIELGRMLYYDPILHKTLQNSCASCHAQTTSFTTFNSNALAHINLGYNPIFLWEGGVEGTMEDIMRFEVEDFFQTKTSRLNQHATYPALFKKVFNVDRISTKEISYALAQYMRTMISSNSLFDNYLKGAAGLNPSQMNGLSIYFSEKGDCFHCHGTSLLTDNLFHNTGLDASPVAGRMNVTNDPNDLGKFKSPTLRNIEFTAPYMHDGRFNTLEEVIDFYSEGVKYSATIDPLMKQVSQGGIRLTQQEKTDLIAFLKTFSDTTYLNNPAFSSPF